MADRAVAAIVKLDVASRGLAFAAAFMKVAKLASEMQEEELRVIAVTLHKDAETLYLCTDGCIR